MLKNKSYQHYYKCNNKTDDQNKENYSGNKTAGSGYTPESKYTCNY